MKPGYLSRNGVPYSGNAVMTEFFDRFDVPGGDSLLVVTSEIVDPEYLATPYWTSQQFKRAERRVTLAPDAVRGAMRSGPMRSARVVSGSVGAALGAAATLAGQAPASRERPPARPPRST